MGIWKQVWKRPDPQLLEAAFSGEYLVAGLRLLIVVLLLYIPLGVLNEQPLSLEQWRSRSFQVLLVALGAALLEALLVYSAVQRNWGRAWLGFVSSLTDVTLVSGALALFLLLDQPLAATNGIVVYPVYFLAIGATSLRYDSRICLLTGLLALAQYAALILYADVHWGLRQGDVVSDRFGSFDLSDQVVRIVLLAAATLLATTLVVRARESSTQSIRDRLTGLLNRRVFEERLREETARAERSGRSLGVAMIDVDRFKQFNDTFGHEGGDVALRALGEQLLRSFRATDIVARYGGEEFSVILPGIDAINAFKRLETVRLAVVKLAMRMRGRDLPVGLTISVGVAIGPDDGSDPHQLMAVADSRLYQAKQQGRNRVVCPVEIDIPQDPEG